MSTTAPAEPAASSIGGELTRSRPRPGETAFTWALRGCVAVSIGFLAALLVFVVYQGWSRLDSRLWNAMPTARESRIDEAGVQSAITGTLWVVLTTAAIALPLGIAAAVYLEEYARRDRWYLRLLELNVQNLAGVPSIVFGILGLGIIARRLGLGLSVITAALTLALLVLPTVIIASREAIRAVPPSIRDASYALGATKWQTVRRQVLPAAVPGIATGSILSVSRAIGEAAPLLLLGAVTLVLFNPAGFDSTYTTLPIQIYNLIASPFESFRELGAAAIVLLLAIVVVLNSAAIYIRYRYAKRW